MRNLERERPRAAIVLIGTALFLWPTALNWHPYLFWDTYGYFLQGKAYAELIAGWAGAGPVPPEAGAGWLGAAGRMLAPDPSIRSPTWSLATYGAAAAGGFWLLALANALVAAATVELALLRLFGLAAARRALAVAGLALVTSLPWFASYLMPDLHAGLTILAAAVIALAWDRLGPAERVGVVALYLAALTFHPSHLLLAAALVAVAALLPADRAERLGRPWRLGLPVAGAVAVSLAIGWVGFGEASLTPHGPPFLLARSWEDGPVRAYLGAACPGEGWAICAHRDRLAPSAQEFLWRQDDSYWSMDPADRAAVRGEERAILARAVLADPLGQLQASLANAAAQIGRFGLDDFVLGRGALVTPDDYTFVYLPTAPSAVWGLGVFTAAIYGAAAVSLAAVLTRARTSPDVRPVVLFFLAALALNAAVCGALSGPHPRYQARVVWLLPMLAAGLLLGEPPAVSRPRGAPAPAAP